MGKNTFQVGPLTGNVHLDNAMLLAYATVDIQMGLDNGRIPPEEKLRSYLELVLKFTGRVKMKTVEQYPELKVRLEEIAAWHIAKAKQASNN
jgi:hypothetical protein